MKKKYNPYTGNLDLLGLTSEDIGKPGGVAGLNEHGIIPPEQLPTTVVSREYTIDFGETTDVVREGNISQTISIRELLAYNIAKLQCVFGGVVRDVFTLTEEQMESLIDAETGEIQDYHLQLESPIEIPPLSSVKWVVYRIDYSESASSTFNFVVI